MHLTCERIYEESAAEIFEHLAKWYNDSAIDYLVRPNFEVGALKTLTVNDVIESHREKPGKYNYIVKEGSTLVGDFSIDLQFPHLYGKIPHTAWIGLCIGNQNYWGTGASQWIVSEIEKICVQLNATRIELGVFEYNKRAEKLYLKCGYVPIGKLTDFVFWNDKWWSDHRMEKWL